jgi:hypothetical protein
MVQESEKRRAAIAGVVVGARNRMVVVEVALRLLTETVEGLALSLQGVDNVQRGDGLSL